MGMYDYYDYGSVATGAAEAVAGFFAVFFLFSLLIVFVWGVLAYILNACGLYTVAKRRGIHHAWLAWIPVGSEWLLGSIADQYQYVTKKRNTNRRTVLLVLEIVMWVLYFLACYGMQNVILSMDAPGTALGVAAGLYALAWLAVVGIVITLAVFYLIALYDFYAACDPSNAVVKLIISIFFTVTIPFFVFFSRKKDLGMPPRKAPAPAIPETEAPVEETPAPEAPAEEAPVEETPAPEAPAEEAPVEETAQEEPQTEVPAQEEPVEAPVEAAPVEEQPTEAETEEQPE